MNRTKKHMQHQTLKQHNSNIIQPFSKLRLPWSSACKGLSKACNSLIKQGGRNFTNLEEQWRFNGSLVENDWNRCTFELWMMNGQRSLAQLPCFLLQNRAAMEMLVMKQSWKNGLQLGYHAFKGFKNGGIWWSNQTRIVLFWVFSRNSQRKEMRVLRARDFFWFLQGVLGLYSAENVIYMLCLVLVKCV